MQPFVEILDHTADIGIRARAQSRALLVGLATEGLYRIIGELAVGGDSEAVQWKRRGTSCEELLRDWLAEVLHMFERDKRVVKNVQVARFDEAQLELSSDSFRIDEQASELHHEIKAITYHELSVKATPEGYEATIIVDI